MHYYENECCDCGLPCIYETCPNYKIIRFECDFCREQNVKLRHYHGYEVCEDCILKEYEVVDGSDW